MPHDQNTGGFFIAIFRKTAQSKKRKRPEHKDIEEDLKYRKFKKELWQSIKDYYGITEDKFRLMTRASGRVVYLM